MLRIVALVENTTSSPKYRCKHGLSLYIETPKHKILFDLGQDKLFAENAKKMNIDISEIDTVIISHGHKDHGGALVDFLSLNTKAKIYIRKAAFDEHYIKVFNLPFSVGLDKKLLQNERLKFTDSNMVIGGFHLYNPPTKKYESKEIINNIADVLNENKSVYYTCHCTGKKVYEIMKKTMGDRLQYLSVGMEILL